jgi:hypothetical protein
MRFIIAAVASVLNRMVVCSEREREREDGSRKTEDGSNGMNDMITHQKH